MTPDEIMAMTDDELDCAGAVANGWVKSGISIPCWVNQNKYVIDVADYHPSRNGSQLLEIMEREKISVIYNINDCKWHSINKDSVESITGNTINQAVLRCYLSSKQGGNNG